MKSLQIVQKNAEGKALIALIGQIDENADYSGVNFEGVQEACFNFEGISLINSTGLQRWINFLETIPSSMSIRFEKCPVRVIAQINMFPGFVAGRDVQIISFFAPYYCQTCDRSSNVLLDRQTHFPSGDLHSAPHLNCATCKQEMEFDGIEKKYFHFLHNTAA